MPRRSAGGGAEYWATHGLLVLALLLMIGWLGAMPRAASPPEPVVAAPEPPPAPVAPPSAADVERRAELLERSEAEAAQLDEWLALLSELCRNGELLARGVRIDCENGSLFLSEGIFFNRRESDLHGEGAANLAAAFPVYLAHLRRDPRIWQSLESIEFRGHSDASATRDPYRVNLVLSQQRALSALLYLTSEGTLPVRDREDLMRLGVASGAAFSRPPSDCPGMEVECRQHWRRVEIRLGLDEVALVSRFRSYADAVQELAPQPE